MHRFSLVLFVAIAGTACVHQVQVAPVKVEPIHMTIDVNLRNGDGGNDVESEATQDAENTAHIQRRAR